VAPAVKATHVPPPPP